jgi:uncharacterized protein YggL (DUF469 family)
LVKSNSCWAFDEFAKTVIAPNGFGARGKQQQQFVVVFRELAEFECDSNLSKLTRKLTKQTKRS